MIVFSPKEARHGLRQGIEDEGWQWVEVVEDDQQQGSALEVVEDEGRQAMNSNRTILMALAIIGGIVVIGLGEAEGELKATIIGSIFGLVGGASFSAASQRVSKGTYRTGLLLAAGGLSVLQFGCSAPQSPTQNDLDGSAVRLMSNSGQNVQQWSDGTAQSTSTAPESAQIAEGRIDYQGTSLSALAAVGPKGINFRNPGNFSADRIAMSFGEPLLGDDGGVLLPLISLEIDGVENEVTTVVDANTAQVEAWVTVLSTLSADQREVFIRAIERDERVSADTLGAIREALGLLGVAVSP